jgi:hypothetical protein
MTAAIQESGKVSISEFARNIREMTTDGSWQFHESAKRLETEVITLFRTTVIATKSMESLDDIAAAWAGMVKICSDAVEQLSSLISQHPDSSAEVYRDRLIDLGSRCQRFQRLHS